MSVEKAPARRKQSDRRAEAEEKLIRAAIEIIAKRGVDGLRLAELGAIAGFSRALPAHYFGHKEDLIRVIVRRIIDNYQLNTRREKSDAPGFGHVTALVEAYVRAMRDHHSNIVALNAVFGAAPTSPDLLPVVSGLNEESTSNVKTSLDQGIGLGEVSAETDTHIEALSLLAFLRGLGSMHLVDQSLPIERISGDYLKAMRARIAPAAGR